MKSKQSLRLAVLLSLAVATLSVSQARAQGDMQATVLPMAVKFAPLDIPGFKPGTKIAVIHGDPNAASGDYVVRLQFPAGYTFPAHWHPGVENVTVLSGTLRLGMGDRYTAAKLQSYPAGSFLYMPVKMSHFGGTRGVTVIQLHGQAPFKIELTKPAM
jgi:quercetin dioxygenase-like cupin family protein